MNIKYLKSWHTPISIVGGSMIGIGIVIVFDYISWWVLATLPLFAVLFFVVVYFPYVIDEWWYNQKHKREHTITSLKR